MDICQHNCRLLSVYDAEALQQLETPATDARVAVVAARRHGLTLTEAGGFVHSKYDPLKEAAQLVKQAAADSAQEGVAGHHIHFGFGLGYLAEADLSRGDAPLLIYEPNPTFFKAALESRDLGDLWRSQRVFVRTTEKGFRALLRRHIGAMNQIQFLINPFHRRVYSEGLRFLLETVKSERNRAGVLRKAEETVYKFFIASTIRSFPWWSRLRDVGLLRDRFKGVPAVIVAAGPSLEKNLAALVPFRERVLVFAMARSVRLLERYGIEPHFLVHTEAKDYAALIHGCTNLTRTVFLLSEQCHAEFYRYPHPLTLTYQNPANLFSRWVVNRFSGLQRTYLPTAGSVATEAFSLATLFGCSPVVLLGQDLGSRQGSHYADAGVNRNFVAGHADHRRTAGYFGGDVETFAHYLHFRDWYAEAVDVYRERCPTQLFINATEGGALIPGFVHRRLQAVLQEAATAAPALSFAPATWLTGTLTETLADENLQHDLLAEVATRLDAAFAAVTAFEATAAAWPQNQPSARAPFLRDALAVLARFSADFVAFFEALPFARAFLPESFVKADRTQAISEDPATVFIEEQRQSQQTCAAWRACLEALAPVVTAAQADVGHAHVRP